MLSLRDRFRTMVNVMGDALATGIMAHICRKDFVKEGEQVRTWVMKLSVSSAGTNPRARTSVILLVGIYEIILQFIRQSSQQ